MVALRQQKNRRIPSADIDPTEIIQGDVSQTITQHFKILRTGLIQHPKTQRYLREFLITDQFGNTYITYFAVGCDGEEYQWPPQKSCRVKPSVITAHHGLTADLFDKMRIEAFREFDRIDEVIRVTRNAASVIAGKIIDGEKLILPDSTPNLILPT